MTRYWCVYTAFGYNTRALPGFPIYTNRTQAANAARDANRFDPQWRGRGLKATECDAYGTPLTWLARSTPTTTPDKPFCCDDGIGHSDGQGGPFTCADYCACFRCAANQAPLI